METIESEHSRDVKKVSVARAGRLRECKNRDFVWELRKTGFCEGGRWVDLSRLRECPLGKLSPYCSFFHDISFLNFFFCYRSSFAVDGVNCTVNKDVEQAIKTFHAAKKPIG